MKRKAKFFLAYAVLLGFSHLWQSFQREDTELWAKSGDGSEGQAILLVFPELAGEAKEGRAFATSFLEARIGEVWVAQRRLSEAPAAVFADSIPEAIPLYLYGGGYGGVDAVLLAAALGERVQRLVLDAPVVSTRFELLGDERLNGALKGFQLAWFWVMEKGIPHFGYSSSLPFNYRVARRVFHADQRLASELYVQLEVPMELRYSGDRPFARSGAAEAYEALRSQETLGFADFPAARLHPGWAGLLLALATFASEDLACIGGGLLAGSGAIGLQTAIVACLLGIFFGDLGIYFMGRFFGATALELPILRSMVSSSALKRSSDWLAKRGVALVVLTRFLPGSRVPTYFAAGVVKVGWIRFTVALFLAAAIWTPILVFAAFYAGEAFRSFFEALGAGGFLGIVAFILVFAVAVRLLLNLATWKGRRLLYARWRRLVGWEFWPIWAVYAPVVLQILWLALRYRSLSLPFSVNPCMPASGLVYESKAQILSHLEMAGVPLARFEAIELGISQEEKLERVRAFMSRLEISYPIVLKPDVGQRGAGVAIVRSETEAWTFFAEQVEDAIVQEFIGGREYGIFYQRFASHKQGEIFSITDKRTTSVVGDGICCLEELILRDPRAVCMAEYFLDNYESQRERVPADGERVMLAAIGTHSRGALFLDGAELLTPELAAEVDRFSRQVEGFHFGRYDLRVPSEAALKRGEGIRVIELNGIASEPTHMYDPKHGPFFGWAALMRQWRAIFALAKENRLAGHEAVSKRYVLRLALAHFRGLRSRDAVPSPDLPSQKRPLRRRS